VVVKSLDPIAIGEGTEARRKAAGHRVALDNRDLMSLAYGSEREREPDHSGPDDRKSQLVPSFQNDAPNQAAAALWDIVVRR
jgi:hypothetical protein